MQLIQPEMQKIQKKYKGKTDPESRQAMTKETMALYKDAGTNPFSSCLPALLQAPVFFALFRVLNNLAGIAADKSPEIGPLSREVAAQANASSIFGAPLSATFQNTISLATGTPLPVPSTSDVKVVCVVMIILMSASTFTSMRQLMMKNMPEGALDNPAGKMQKNMMYLMPLMFIFSGVTFPIGVLLYWLTTNLWSMGQQFYTIRRMPAPGSPAELALAARRKKSGKEHKKFSIPGFGHDAEPEPVPEDVQDTPTDTKPKSGQRQQPKRKKRNKPAGQGDGSPNPTSNGSAPPSPTSPGAKPSGAKPPGAKPPGAKRPGGKPAAAVDGDSKQ
jgi:YidC/Oxa1 family membrane protein insertase